MAPMAPEASGTVDPASAQAITAATRRRETVISCQVYAPHSSGAGPLPDAQADPSRSLYGAGMASGYSGTPQARKLGLKPGQRIALDGSPAGWSLSDPPPGLVDVAAPEPADVIVGFFAAAAELPLRLPALVERIRPAGALWVAWPRRAGGHQSDITDGVVRNHALPLGVVDVKVAAIDEDWSGLRLVWRLANRAPSHPAP
jgi:hypothetical protein